MNDITRTHAFPNRHNQRGLSLIELMISITIGLIILAVVTTLFVNQSTARAELDKSNRMIDNGRYALQVLSDSLSLAGFYDNYVPTGTPTAIPDPCNLATITSATTNGNVLSLPAYGFNAGSGVIAAPITGDGTTNKCSFTTTAGSSNSLKSGSDILVLSRAGTTDIAVSSAVSTTTYLQVSSCATDAVPYQITTGAPGTNLYQKDCTTAANLRPFLVQVYFVSPDNDPAGSFTGTRSGCTGDCIPTLKRMELDPTGLSNAFVVTPLVEGIEYMQVDYGLDTNNDGAADSYVDCSACTTANWGNIVSATINIIARNTQATASYTDTKTYALGTAGNFGPFNDHYKRHAYTQVIRLVNPSSRREVPCTLPCR